MHRLNMRPKRKIEQLIDFLRFKNIQIMDKIEEEQRQRNLSKYPNLRSSYSYAVSTESTKAKIKKRIKDKIIRAIQREKREQTRPIAFISHYDRLVMKRRVSEFAQTQTMENERGPINMNERESWIAVQSIVFGTLYLMEAAVVTALPLLSVSFLVSALFHVFVSLPALNAMRWIEYALYS